MTTTELYRYQHSIEEIRGSISHQLNASDDEHDTLQNREVVSKYTDSMTDLVFEAIENSIFWTDKVNDLEAFRDKIQEAVKSLDIAIDVWKRSEAENTESSRQITKQHH